MGYVSLSLLHTLLPLFSLSHPLSVPPNMKQHPVPLSGASLKVGLGDTS
uniref:Uncharacterized protein n=1 Tax=Anguilla anguilla TaxID=7936 RepID=A0A0E9PXG2_ANGAN